MTDLEPRVNILGVGVSAISLTEAVDRSLALVEAEQHGYVCVTGVHGVMEAQDDERFRQILNRSFLTTPDGVPTVWLGRLHGFRTMTRVYGPDYMLALCDKGRSYGCRHFLYGGKPGVAEQLRESLMKRFPGVQIVGTFTPPFRRLTSEEEEDLRLQLEDAAADVFWVGLSTPKQETFMGEYHERLPVKLMVGVGAAFDLLSGNLREAPDWVKQIGMQWLYRLMMEPRRLWRRYFRNNPRFLIMTVLQLTRMRSYSFTQSELGKAVSRNCESLLRDD